VARAWTAAWLSVAVGSVLAPAGSEAQAQVQPIEAVSPAEPGVGRAPRAHDVLRTGTECYRRGDYETAAAYFQRAQAGQDDLTADERQSLGQWLQLNETALRARRDASDQLRQVEDAMRQGRMQEALTSLKTVTPNQQFLAAADKQRLQQVTEQLLPSRLGPTQSPGMGNAAALSQARSKLAQARLMIGRGNYDAAQALALEANHLNATYTMGEDTPRKVLDDITEARMAASLPSDTKTLLARARAALARGNFDEAERMAQKAEEQRSPLTSLRFWDDSPSKVLKDIQAARGRQLTQKNPPKPADKPPESFSAMKPYNQPQAPMTGDTAAAANTETARKMLKDARQALRAGDLALARELCDKARSLKPELNWWEDTPDKIVTEIRQVEGSAAAAKSPYAGAYTPASTPTAYTPADPRSALKQARDLFNTGKIEEAERLAQQANTGKVRWGLFEDSPDKLMADIRKTRGKRDQDESVQLLAEGRRLYEKGDLAGAERLAHAAERKHGPYSVWDLNDRPSKLLADIEAAKSRTVQPSVPPVPDMVSAAKPSPFSSPVPLGAERTPFSPPVPLGTERTTGSMERVATRTTTTPYMPQPTGGMVENRKLQALALLTQARQYQKDGRLLEARQKAAEAQRVGAVFGPAEDSPEQCLVALGALCQRRIESHLQQANEYLATAELDNSRYQRAETELTQARQLATAFGFDTQLIDNKLSVVQQARTRSWSNGQADKNQISQIAHQEYAQPRSDAVAPQGHELLNQARMELRAGQTVSARKLAVAAFDPRYAVQEEASQVLRSIDAEEFNQKLLTAERTFEAAMTAFQRREYAQASTMLRSLDYHLLSPEKQARLKEVMLVPEMQPSSALAQTAHNPTNDMAGAGRAMARATDYAPVAQQRSDPDFAREVQAMQEVKMQKLRNEGIDAQKDATKMFQAGDTDRALEVLQDYKKTLEASGLDSDRQALLRRPIDSRLAQFNMLKQQRDFEKKQVDQQTSVQRRIVQERMVEQEKKEKVAELMKQFKALFKEAKYPEAMICAHKALDLDPDNTVAEAAIYTTRMAMGVSEHKKDKQGKEDMVLGSLNDTDKEGPFLNSSNPVAFDRERSLANRDRKPLDELFKLNNIKSEKEQQIYRRLDQPISSMDFKEMPLKQILDDVQGLTGINIVVDEPALMDAGISLDKQITQRLSGISLKSALYVLLQQVHLTYVVQNEVLNVTTEDHARGKCVVRIHPVLDLVTPVLNSDGSAAANVLKTAAQPPDSIKLNGTAPYQSLNSLGGGKDVSLSQLGAGPGANGTVVPTVTTSNGQNVGLQETLIKLITNTIQPQTWSSMGGHGTIEFYPLGQALIINQTPDIQEQVAELLQALRRLQDQEVAIEVRFITIAESFYERIGVDFSVNIRTDNSKYEPQIVSQQFRPFGFLNVFTPKSFVSGLTPAGTFTQDLNIPIKPSSFQMAIPPFGEYPNIPGSNGGVSLGLAFLSDIEVYMFMEAAAGDQRTNVMEAPKITMFNGQTSTISVTDQQFFVTQVQVLQAGGQIVFVPTNSLFPTGGVNLTLNSVISADRRFVRMSITPTLNSLASANVPLFPITTFITPIFEGGAVGQPIPFTQFIQQPTFNTITVNTTVNVPDGGTVLLGGLKRLNEGRNEFGPPILSQIPYLNRLFKNVGYGREAESLMIMVTPRIIINEEEELKAVPGLGATSSAPEQAPAPR